MMEREVSEFQIRSPKDISGMTDVVTPSVKRIVLF